MMQIRMPWQDPTLRQESRRGLGLGRIKLRRLLSLAGKNVADMLDC